MGWTSTETEPETRQKVLFYQDYAGEKVQKGTYVKNYNTEKLEPCSVYVGDDGNIYLAENVHLWMPVPKVTEEDRKLIKR